MLPQSGADIPVCARPRGQAGMSATHYHAPSLRLAETASPHLRLRAFARASPALDDRRRHPTTINHNRHRLASGRQAPSSMTISRPFRASLFSPRYPGRCPGLVCFAPSGLSSTLSQAAPVTGHGGPVQREWPGRSRAGSGALPRPRAPGLPILPVLPVLPVAGAPYPPPCGITGRSR